MKISIQVDPTLSETEVVIRCHDADRSVAAIAAGLRMYDRKITGVCDGRTFIVSVQEVLYMESVDGRTFAYTNDKAIEVAFKLYELEDRFADNGIVRASKSSLINLFRISSLRPYIGGRMVATLDNGEDTVISRKYASSIKRMLGIGRSAL